MTEQKPAANSGKPSSSPLPEPISFRQLSQGAAEVLVEHDGQIYRLKLTRNGKLILNK